MVPGRYILIIALVAFRCSHVRLFRNRARAAEELFRFRYRMARTLSLLLRKSTKARQ